MTDRSQPQLRPRIPDGYLDRMRKLADRLEAGADELFHARFDPRDPSVAHHARMDADRCMRDVASEMRQLR